MITGYLDDDFVVLPRAEGYSACYPRAFLREAECHGREESPSPSGDDLELSDASLRAWRTEPWPRRGLVLGVELGHNQDSAETLAVGESIGRSSTHTRITNSSHILSARCLGLSTGHTPWVRPSGRTGVTGYLAARQPRRRRVGR
jgi:hypothetical protein